MARGMHRWWGLAAAVVAALGMGGVNAHAAGIARTFLITQGHTGFQRSSPLTPPLEQAWHRHFPGDVWYTVSDGRRVFFLASAHDSLVLYALDGATGRRLWGPVDVGGVAGNVGREEPEPGWGWLTFDGTHVFVASRPGLVMAYAASDGRRLWANAFPELNMLSSFPAVWDDRVLAQSAGGGLRELDASTGSPLGPLLGGAGGDALSGSALYGTTDCDAAWAYSLPERSVLWTHIEGCSTGPGLIPVVGGGLVFSRNDQGSGLPDEALSAEDGHLLRTIPHGGSAPVVDGSLTLARVGTTVSATQTATGASPVALRRGRPPRWRHGRNQRNPVRRLLDRNAIRRLRADGQGGVAVPDRGSA
jgi:outer membrane protein assembly factor BamB